MQLNRNWKFEVLINFSEKIEIFVKDLSVFWYFSEEKWSLEPGNVKPFEQWIHLKISNLLPFVGLQPADPGRVIAF